MLAVPALALIASAPQAPPAASVQATATIRIVQGSSASAKDWNAASRNRSADGGHARELIVREPDGRTSLLRLIEHE
ncbi:MAG: hypothetical protein ACTHJK_14420 [Sphingomicrobium sp.]